jgi:hypothetical protein
MFRRLNYGAIPGFGPLCWDANDPNVIFHGVATRLLRTLPTPNLGSLRRFAKFVERFLDKMQCPIVQPLAFEEWLVDTNYGEERKEQLRRVYAEMRNGRPTAQQKKKVLLFGKSEMYVNFKSMRGIYSRNDYCKAWAGRYIKALEKLVYEWRDEDGDNYFIKHIPVVDRGAFLARFQHDGLKYYSNDFTAFESHFTELVMRCCEGQLYERAFGAWGKEYTDMLCGKQVLRTRDRRVKVMTRAHRMSGEMSTSLGNGFTNLMLGLFIAEEHKTHIKIVVEGDDSLIATGGRLDPKWYAELGFTIKCEEVFTPGDASFCGMLSADNGETIKDPMKFLSSFGWTHNMINAGPKVLDELLRAKALSACYETPQCPILGVLAREALRRTRHVRARWVRDGFHENYNDEFPLAPFNPALSTRLAFQRNFGVAIETQLQVERYIVEGKLESIQLVLPPSSDIAEYVSKFVVVDSLVQKSA